MKSGPHSGIGECKTPLCEDRIALFAKARLRFPECKKPLLKPVSIQKDPNEMTDDTLLPVLNCVSTRLRTHSEEQKTKKIAVLECALAQPRALREPRRLAGLLQAADEMVF
jgi:hypothetical protein